MIHVVQAIHDKSGDYARHLCVAMESYLSNTKSQVCVHILHDDTLTDNNRRIIQELADRHHGEVRFYNIDIRKMVGTDVDRLTGEFTVGTLFRLKMVDVLTDIHKAIYLDLDIVCTLDLQELWDVDISGHCMAAMPEHGMEERVQSNANLRDFYSKVPIVNERYFNAGIILFDLDRIRSSHDLFKEAMDYIAAHPDTPFSDQDALNYIFQSEYKHLDKRFNFRPHLVYMKKGIAQAELAELYAGKLWHFAGHKPWVFLVFRPFELYWHYFARTAWGDTPSKLWKWMDKMKKSVEFPYEDGGKTCIVKIEKPEGGKMLFHKILSSQEYMANFARKLARDITAK